MQSHNLVLGNGHLKWPHKQVVRLKIIKILATKKRFHQ